MNRGQMKIQQMAFVLVAIVIFFAMIGLFYFSIRISTMQKNVISLREEEAKELVKKLASTPEFSYAQDCVNCIDFDKLIVLKEKESYKGFWNLDYLAVERIYPKKQGECTRANYPECDKITIIEKTDYGIPAQAFIALCRWEEGAGGYSKCELARLYAAGKSINRE